MRMYLWDVVCLGLPGIVFSELCYRSQRDIQPLTGFSCTISVCVCFRRFLADTILVLNAGFLWSIGVFDLDL